MPPITLEHDKQMANKTQPPYTLHLQKALDYLKENNFNGFLEEMASLGEWIQDRLKISKFKGGQTSLAEKLPAAALPPLTLQQTLAFEIIQNAWQDTRLARLRSLQFVSDGEAPALPNSCHFLRIKDSPFWEIIPIDSRGEKGPSLNPAKLSEVSDLTARLTVNLINKDPEAYTAEEKVLVGRLMQALKDLNLETLDQKKLAAKAAVEKKIRHRVKLGMEALKQLCPSLISSAEGADSSGSLNLQILDHEPLAAEIKEFPPATYVVIPPQKGHKGRLFFYPTNTSKKQEIKPAVLKKVKAEALQATLSERQIMLMAEEPSFKERAASALTEKIKPLILDYHCRQLDEKAKQAILQQRTFKQKITRLIGNLLAAITAFTYGGVELVATLVGFFVAVGVVWTNPGLAIGGILLLAGAVIFPFPSIWTNWKVFSTYVPEFFNKIHEEYKVIPTNKKKALFWSLALLALATGMAAGGLAYTATIALPSALGLGAISFIFPPLGVIFALAILSCQTMMLIRNFTTILRKENSWKAFKKSFLQVNQLLKDTNASRARRIFTWIMVVGLTLLSTLGLAMSCFTASRSVGKFFIDQLSTAPEKALMLGVAIGGISAFFSRIYFTLDSAITAALILCKRLFIRVVNLAKDTLSASENKLHPITRKKIAAIVTDSALAGAFYAQNILSLAQQTPGEASQDVNLLSGLPPGPAAAIAAAAFFTAGGRYTAINLAHADQPDDPYEKARQDATDSRVSKSMDFYLKKNPNCIFTAQEAKTDKMFIGHLQKVNSP